MRTLTAFAPRPTKAPANSKPASADARAFVRVETFGRCEAAREAWNEIERTASASAYQGFDFARLWSETIGASRGQAPLIVVAHDEAGRVTALLPLVRFSAGPLRLAAFLGGKDANFGMGLFRSGVDWSPKDVGALLDAAARSVTPPVDALLLANQPRKWEGAPNPMVGEDAQRSPSDAFKTALPSEFAVWRDAHASKDAQKKLRKKANRLTASGVLAHRRAADADDAARILEAFHEQRSARVRALGISDPYDPPAARAFLDSLANTGLAEGAPRLELHALLVGSRIVATFGAVCAGDRMSGLFLSHDADPEIARSSPGELIVHEIVRDAIARGFRTLDLGVGESRYKSQACEAADDLFDAAHAATRLGGIAAFGFLAKQRLKRRIKQSPRWLEYARRLRKALSR